MPAPPLPNSNALHIASQLLSFWSISRRTFSKSFQMLLPAPWRYAVQHAHTYPHVALGRSLLCRGGPPGRKPVPPPSPSSAPPQCPHSPLPQPPPTPTTYTHRLFLSPSHPNSRKLFNHIYLHFSESLHYVHIKPKHFLILFNWEMGKK